MTWLKFVNVFFFQWFFIRLVRCTGTDRRVFDINFGWNNNQIDINDIEIRVYWLEMKYKYFGIYGFVLPLTGWYNDYTILGRPFCKQITRKKYVTS